MLKQGMLWIRAGLLAGLLVSLTGCAVMAQQGKTPVTLSGAQHMGKDYNVPAYYVNGSMGGPVSRSGTGGTTCCVVLPNEWKPGLTAKVMWTVNDWKNDTGQAYTAIVPVERYEKPSRLFVHFFEEGRVRIVVNRIGPWPVAGDHNGHPIVWGDPHAADSATAGTRIKSLFEPDPVQQTETQAQAEARP